MTRTLRLRLAPLVAIALAAPWAGLRHCHAQEADRLSRIIGGEAFDQLGEHGQAVTLYLAATKAPSWDEARPLLERIWRDYPDSTAVDVAYAFAGRHYRDENDTRQAVRYFEQALKAARERGRPWTEILLQELERLRPTYAQAPAAPAPGLTTAPRTIDVPLDGTIGHWKTRDDADSTITVRPGGMVEISTEALTPENFGPAYFLVEQDLVVTGVALRLRIEPSVRYQVQLGDRDGTLVAVNSWDFRPDADGSRRIEADFASLDNVGPGNFLMEELAGLSLVVLHRFEPGTKVRVLIEGLTFRLGDPVRTANAPAGDAAFERRWSGQDEQGSNWMPFGVSIAHDGETVHDGQTSMRVSAVIDELGPKRSGGHATLVPRADAHWLGDRLVFWCFPRDLAFLPVIINSRNGMQLSVVLGPEQLTVGKWNRVEALFTQAHQTATTVEDSFGEVASVLFLPSTTWDLQGEHIKQAGEYVWYIDDVHVEGEGPVKLAHEAAAIPDLGLEMAWSVKGGCTIQPETEVVQAGDTAACLTVELDETEHAGGNAIARPPDGRPWPATGITFACLAATAPVLTVMAQDSDGTSVMWVLGEEDLWVGEWNVVHLSPEGRVNVAGGDDVMNDIALLVFGCHKGPHPYLQTLPPIGPVTWYLDSFEITDDQPVPVKPHPARAQDREALQDDTGDPMVWREWGRVRVEGELVIVRDGSSSLEMTAFPKRADTADYAIVEARPEEPRKADAVTFWLWPDEAGPLCVLALDADTRMARWTVPADALQPRAWNEVHLPVGEAYLIQGGPGGGAQIAPEQLGPITSVKFALGDSGSHPDSRRTWYIDSLRLSEGEEEPCGLASVDSPS